MVESTNKSTAADKVNFVADEEEKKQVSFGKLIKVGFRNIYRDIFTKEYDHYDTVASGSKAGLSGKKCMFCELIVDHSKIEPWYEDDDILIFSDKKPRAKLHGLCIPKRHIRDINALKE